MTAAHPLSLPTSPEIDGNAPDALEQLREWATAHGVEEVECVLPDLAGIARGKVMPLKKFLREAGVRLPMSTFFATINGDYTEDVGPQLYTDPDLVLTPDLSAVRSVPWANDRSLQIMHDVETEDGSPYEVAPRQVLRRVVALYAERGWYPVVAPELEFYLVKPNHDPNEPLEPPTGRSGRQSFGNQAFSLSAVDEYDEVIELIYDYADAQNIAIDTIIQEAGPAQLEINMLHGDPIKLADEVFLFKRLIREAALRCGLYATFMAKPYGDQLGSAMHIHMSVTDRDGRNIFSNDDGTASLAHDAFVGGQQTHFHAATALVAPYVNSYRRLIPGWSAPINLDWGVDNRTTGLRSPRAEPAARRVENRVAGADANPYLALAATLACGYLGLTQNLAPRVLVKGNSYSRDRDLPPSLLDAVEALAASDDLRGVLGDKFVDTFCAVKRSEHDQFMQVISPWERKHLLMNV
ncbi:glutamine synthetase family protein [Pontivivens insulae]|uniref:Gamma-glutamylputrescine synthetase PuuA n=1 Tax=Pontivivens insulae TaxID=1639689 RepID=A0A2R8ACX6_9RHOB|nr:glutamine synthetase family protein [Pontivivens insulae]RED14023.1 glutamine synthetase [Pontivivens insulae]SPF30097.1 Gamma-glutamylputrescine synthetase PuuA [Pontivivens insulae]